MDQGVAGHAGPCSLRYMAPAPDLRDIVTTYYLFHADLPRYSDLMRADLAQLRFMLKGHGAYRFAGGRLQLAPEVGLLGPTMSASCFDVEGPLMVFGIGIHPAGWSALIRDDASRFAEGVHDATLILPGLTDMRDALAEAPTPRHMAAIADAAVRRLMAAATTPPLWFTSIADSWLIGDASPQVDSLIARTGMSARQVERVSRRIYGAPPKLLARKFRALRAASLIANSGLDWEEATDDSYYDQSHFIRDFKRFAGMTPRRFVSDSSPVTRLTLQRRALAGRIADIAALT